MGSKGRPRMVIIGGGFAGLNAARHLKDAPIDITLVDKRNHHLFQPLLYQVATAGLSPGDIAEPIRTILRSQENAYVEMSEVVDIDTEGAQVLLKHGAPLAYDYLLLATGVTHTYFGRDEQWSDLAPGLKTLEDAVTIRSRFLAAFEEAEKTRDPAARQRLLTFVIVGAGPTGVELAGTMSEMAKNSLSRDFDNITDDDSRIILVESNPRVLKTYPEKLSAKAKAALVKRGVEVRNNCRVTNIDNEGVFIGEERLEAANVFWAAGVKANPLGAKLGCPTNSRGCVQVLPDLSVPGHPEIFVAGDLADITDAEGKAVPGVAQGALQMGRHVAKVVAGRLEGRPAPAPFVYKDRGSMATIGRKDAVVHTKKLQLSGMPAWLMWVVVHLAFLVGFDNRLLVFIQWTWYWLTYKQGTRLITENYRGHEDPRHTEVCASDELA